MCVCVCVTQPSGHQLILPLCFRGYCSDLLSQADNGIHLAADPFSDLDQVSEARRFTSKYLSPPYLQNITGLTLGWGKSPRPSTGILTERGSLLESKLVSRERAARTQITSMSSLLRRIYKCL